MDLELDALECPICLSLFQGSIFQCKNGHAVCDACHARIQGTCPSCREPVVGDIRCRALENVIAGMALPCAFSSHGCTQLLKLKERRDHEAFLCLHAPFACPFRGCAYSGMQLYDHIHDAHVFFVDYLVGFTGSKWWVSLHRSTLFMVLLEPEDRRVFLLLNGGGVRSGRSFSVVCLGPSPAANQLLEYKLEVGGAAGQPGKLSLTARSVPCMRSWEGKHPADGFLFVPDAYWTSLDTINVNVLVQKSSTANNAGRSLNTWSSPCPCSEVDSLCPQVDTHWSLPRWLRQPSLKALDPVLVLPVVFVFTTMAVMLALAWKMSTPSSVPEIPKTRTLWDTCRSNFITLTRFI